MYILTLVVMLSVTLCSYLTDIRVAPQAVKYFPEVLSVIVVVYVLAAGARQRFKFVGTEYWIAFAALSIVIICGVTANGVAPGPVFGGLRYYLRAMPLGLLALTVLNLVAALQTMGVVLALGLFLLPAVLEYDDWQLQRQLKLLFGISLLQLPIAGYQRLLVMRLHHWSGDPVIGTLIISSILSIFLIAGICIMAGLTLKGRLSRFGFVVGFLLLVLPTTINETKGTLFLLPVGLITTLLVGSEPGKRMRIVVGATTLMVLFLAIYIPIYDYFSTRDNPYPVTIASFFGNEQNVEHYVNQNAELGTRKEAGRLDAITVPLHGLASDPVKLVFGVGIGNASHSSLGGNFNGAYYALFGRYAGISSASTFILEIGLLGLALVFWLYWLIFRDSLFVAANSPGTLGGIALGWTGITIVMAISTFYKATHVFDSLSYLFWYFSGLIAAGRMRITLSRPAATVTEPRPLVSSRRPRTRRARARSREANAGR